MANVGVKGGVGVDVVLRRSSVKVDDRGLRRVRVERDELVADDPDEVQRMVWSTPDDPDAFLEFEHGLQQKQIIEFF